MVARLSSVLSLALMLSAPAWGAPKARAGKKAPARASAAQVADKGKPPSPAPLTKPAGAPLRAPKLPRRENPYLEVPDRAYAESTLAYLYANLSGDEALAELGRRGVAWVAAEPSVPSVRTPVRLAGPLHGVSIHSTLAPAARMTSDYEILDARLALALDDFTALLAKHDIVEIVHYTMYRPPAVTPPEPSRQIRHPAGLAIDLASLKKRDGRWLTVGEHWPSDIGKKTCGAGAKEHEAREARELVSIVCEAMDRRIFHFMLTPDFDAAHADHLHLEIKPGARSFMVN